MQYYLLLATCHLLLTACSNGDCYYYYYYYYERRLQEHALTSGLAPFSIFVRSLFGRKSEQLVFQGTNVSLTR